MICLKCDKDTPDTDKYCHHCGTTLDVTFDEISAKLKADLKDESGQETEEFFRWILVMLVAVMIVAMFFKSRWTNLPNPETGVNYIPKLETEKHVETIHQPHLYKESNN